MNSFLTIQIKEGSFHIAIFILALIVSGCVSETITKKQPVEYVNPFIGTKASSERASTDGRTHPGACVPFGMTKWTPVNVIDNRDPYKYVEDTGRIKG